MTLRFYPAIIEAVADGGFGASFPDLPGCISAGATVQEAATYAAEALALHLAGLVEDKETVPAPSAPDAPLPDWLAEASPLVRVLVPVDVPGRSLRVNITLDEGLLSRLDVAAAAEGASRSGFIAAAVRRALQPA